MERWNRQSAGSAVRLVDDLENEEGRGESEGQAEPVGESCEEDGRERRKRRKTGKPAAKREPVQKTTFVVDYPENIRALKVKPEPFIEPLVKPYSPDPTDEVMPEPGFLSDFVNIGRGMEAPALFYMVAGLWAISTALTRETWVKWAADFKLWPNIFALLVSPPALCKKSTVIDMVNKLVRSLPEYMPNSLEASKKRLDIVNGKTTPEGLLTFMNTKKTTMIDERDKEHPKFLEIDHGSQGAISVGEFATFLGKQKYNLGMVPLLTDLYDCAETNTEMTRGMGAITLNNIYTNLLGGITPDGLRLSIPEEAFGGGFMSRCLVAFVGTPVRFCPFPMTIEGYPTLMSLYPKFAWIINRARGEYTFTPEAVDYYSKWYMKWKKKLVEKDMEKQDTFRMDSILVRISCLMRIQDYAEGQVIDVKHMKAAQKLLEAVYAEASEATDDIGRSEESILRKIVERVLARRGSMSRRKLAVYMSPRKCSSTDLMAILMELYEEGQITISLDGVEMSTLSRDSKELYTWTGKDEGDDDDDDE